MFPDTLTTVTPPMIFWGYFMIKHIRIFCCCSFYQKKKCAPFKVPPPSQEKKKSVQIGQSDRPKPLCRVN